MGYLGSLVGSASDFGSGHDLTVCGFEPHVRLCADSSEPGARFRFCVSLSLCPSPAHALSLSVSKINKNIKKKKKKETQVNPKSQPVKFPGVTNPSSLSLPG